MSRTDIVSEMGRRGLLVVLLGVLMATGPRAGVIHVPADQPTIQAGIMAAQGGDHVLVAPGTYHEAISFLGKGIVVESIGGSALTIIDATGLGTSVVSMVNGEPEATRLEGFTITGGNSVGNGGGITIGGDCFKPGPEVAECLLSGNTAAGLGGGIYAARGVIDHCQLVENQAASGGGAYACDRVAMRSCLVNSNVAINGGGVFLFYNAGSDVSLVECTISRNQGGGVYVRSENFFTQGTVAEECVIADNTGGGAGSGLTYDPYIDNIDEVTLLLNSVLSGNGLAVVPQGHFATGYYFIVGSILSGAPLSGYYLYVSWSDDVGGRPGTGNIAADPLFVDPVHLDFHLQPGSPCIDAGDPAASLPAYQDIDGEARIANGRIDMGVDEVHDCDGDQLPDYLVLAAGMDSDIDGNHVPDACDPDCNGNGLVDGFDLILGTSHDCNLNGIPDECEPVSDCNDNGQNDACDIATGISKDCNGNGTPDECDIASGSSSDENGNGVPDECESIMVPQEAPTIAVAVAMAEPGTTILLAPGTWSGPGFSGITVNKLLHFKGAAGPEVCVIDGTAAAGARFATLNVAGCSIEGLTFRAFVSGSVSGGAISAGYSVEVKACRFENCSTSSLSGGGAIILSGNAGQKSVISNCVFSGNHSGTEAGALVVTGQQLAILHCSFVDNAAISRGDDISIKSNAKVAVSDSIFWSPSSQLPSIYFNGAQSTLGCSTSDVLAGRFGVQFGTNPGLFTWGAGNLDADPQFVDAAFGDFHLVPGSPCINAGDPAGEPDADNSPPDMGAYAYQPWVDLGGGVGGSFGVPLLEMNGPLTGDTAVTWSLSSARAGTPFVLIAGFSEAGTPYYGGILWPMPDALVNGLEFGPEGAASGYGRWPLGVPPGTSIWLQAWYEDIGAPAGAAGSNGMRGTAP